jgi:hypothetical protein
VDRANLIELRDTGEEAAARYEKQLDAFVRLQTA